VSLSQYAPNLEVFLDVVRAGSFSSAARRVGVAPSSIVRQVDALEAELGTELFIRSTRALTLTDAGERLIPRATAILEQLVDTSAEIAALNEAPQGVLRISSLPTFSRLYLAPVAGDLLKRYPLLQVELDVTERVTDPSTERLDAAIRIGDVPDSGLIATHLGFEKWVVCASPAYLREFGQPKRFSDLCGHRRIDKRHSPANFGWNRILPDSARSKAAPVFRCDDYEAQRLAAVDDFGIAFLPTWLVGADIRAGRLALVFDDRTNAEFPIRILRSMRKAPAKLVVFIDALTRHIGSPPLWERALRKAASR
jgi:DNA-binding transcriptional LysR family regulator